MKQTSPAAEVDARPGPTHRQARGAGTLYGRVIKHRWIYLIALPGFVYLLLFKFGPMWGLLLAFQHYNPFQGFLGSEWVGLKNFTDLFNSPLIFNMLRNTLLINLFALVFYFPLPIILALMLNEVRHSFFKRLNQSIVYMPYFLSWVIIVSFTVFLLSVDVGLINKLLVSFGFEPVKFLTTPKYFWGLLTAQIIWKDAGWGTIIFLAAIAGVDPQRYEAAVCDGASRFRQIWHVTLPAIRPTIVILLILQLGNMADVGFEQVLLMLNPLVREVGEVLDTYAFTQGIQRGNISVGITVGFFKGLLGLVLVVIANYTVKKLGYEGIF